MSRLPSRSDTIVALATPEGVGALGVVRVSGPKAVEVTKALWKGADLGKLEAPALRFGRILDGEKVLDEVVLSLFRAPRSYTGDDIVELSAHGSPYVLRRIVELYQENGVRLAGPGEFTMRAFLAGKLDLTQAEAVADLIAADSESAQHAAMRQLKGETSDALKLQRQALIDLAALLELELDFGEEDVEFAERTELTNRLTALKKTLRELADTFALGNAVKEGIPTVIAGRPNAGKSTLLNALLDEERALVSDIAGTTRDSIEASLVIEGLRFRLVDTAGLRKTEDPIEALGIERSYSHLAKAALVLYLIDLSQTTPGELEAELSELPRDTGHWLLIGNKADLIKNPQDWAAFPLLLMSAKNTEQIVTLRKEMAKASGAANLPQDRPILTSGRHLGSIREAMAAIDRAEQSLQAGLSGELLAQDLRLALQALGEITGEVTPDDVLGAIFSKFCIGK